MGYKFFTVRMNVKFNYKVPWIIGELLQQFLIDAMMPSYSSHLNLLMSQWKRGMKLYHHCYQLIDMIYYRFADFEQISSVSWTWKTSNQSGDAGKTPLFWILEIKPVHTLPTALKCVGFFSYPVELVSVAFTRLRRSESVRQSERQWRRVSSGRVLGGGGRGKSLSLEAKPPLRLERCVW